MEQENRYSRQLSLPGFGPEAQSKLQLARVLVIGAGGLGVPTLQYLAGMGIGNLGIMDGDIISMSNLHRQVLYAENEVGKLKADVAAEKLLQLNSTIAIRAIPEFVSPENALEILAGYDLIVDATDNFAARYLINDACVLLKKPFIYGAVYQFEGQVSLMNFENGPTYRCLYPTPPSGYEIPNCNTNGILGVVPGIIGLHQALEAVKVLTGVGENLSAKLLLIDLLHNTQHRISYKLNPENLKIKSLRKSYAPPVNNITSQLEPQELLDWIKGEKEFILIDVREPEEFEKGFLPLARLLPLSDLKNNALDLPSGKPFVIYCQTGKRSNSAVDFLKQNQPDKEVYQLKGGLENWLKTAGLNKQVV